MPLLLRRAGAGLTAALVLSALVPAAASAASPATHRAPHATGRPLAAAAGWLATQFADATNLPHPDGNHFGATYGTTYYPDYGLNADAIFGMAATGVAGAKIATALRYLRRHVDDYADLSGTAGGPYDGSVAKAALAVIVAGGHPRFVAGHNLVRTLHRDECRAGSTSCAPGQAANIYSSVSESFVLLAEARGNSGVSPAALSYFRSLQCANGGFTGDTTACGSGTADLDSTSYAVMALQAVGGHRAMLDRAVRWLRGQEKPAGYWVSQSIPNVNSTGLAAGALAGVGRPVRAARTWLRSQQVPAGHRAAGAFRYGGTVTATTTAATSPSVIATAQALTGLAPHGSLAVVREPAAATSVAPLHRPVARTASTARRGSRQKITGVGFAAGERVRVTLLGGTRVGRGVAGSLGVVRTRWRVLRTLAPGRHTVVLHGLASHLAARHRVRVVPAAATQRAASATFTSATFTGATFTGATFTGATFTGATTATPTHVGIVITGQGINGQRCVAWHKGITGDAILNRVATVGYRSDGLIVTIDGKPSSGTADGTHFWSYWHDTERSGAYAWHYSTSGASGFLPKAGTVEGWSYDDGAASPPKPAAKPAGLYASICGAKDAAVAPVPVRTTTADPSPSARTRTSHAAVPARTVAPASRTTTPGVAPSRTAVPVSHPASATTSRVPQARRTRSTTAPSRSHPASREPAAVPAARRQPPRRLLTKPTAATSTGSPVGTYVAIGLAVVLLAGGAFAAMRRRSSP